MNRQLFILVLFSSTQSQREVANYPQETLVVRVKAADCGGVSKRGAFFVRFANGISLPISVNVN